MPGIKQAQRDGHQPLDMPAVCAKLPPQQDARQGLNSAFDDIPPARDQRGLERFGAAIDRGLVG